MWGSAPKSSENHETVFNRPTLILSSIYWLYSESYSCRFTILQACSYQKDLSKFHRINCPFTLDEMSAVSDKKSTLATGALCPLKGVPMRPGWQVSLNQSSEQRFESNCQSRTVLLLVALASQSPLGRNVTASMLSLSPSTGSVCSLETIYQINSVLSSLVEASRSGYCGLKDRELTKAEWPVSRLGLGCEARSVTSHR